MLRLKQGHLEFGGRPKFLGGGGTLILKDTMALQYSRMLNKRGVRLLELLQKIDPPPVY